MAFPPDPEFTVPEPIPDPPLSDPDPTEVPPEAPTPTYPGGFPGGGS